MLVQFDEHTHQILSVGNGIRPHKYHSPNLSELYSIPTLKPLSEVNPNLYMDSETPHCKISSHEFDVGQQPMGLQQEIRFIGWQRNMNTIKNKRKPRFIDWQSFVFGHVYIPLPSSIADFIPRDAFLQKVHLRNSQSVVKDAHFVSLFLLKEKVFLL